MARPYPADIVQIRSARDRRGCHALAGPRRSAWTHGVGIRQTARVAGALRTTRSPERPSTDLDPDLLAHFTRYFEILRADTPALLEQVFRLRYAVYCQEGCLPGFDPVDYPDGLERDIYDYEHRSVHCLLRHRPTGSNAGTVRLVLADPVQPDALFPIEVAAGGAHRPGLFKQILCRPAALSASAPGFIVARRFRSRRGEQQWPDGLAEEALRPIEGATSVGSQHIRFWVYQGGHDQPLGAAGSTTGTRRWSRDWIGDCVSLDWCSSREPAIHYSRASPLTGIRAGSPRKYAPAASRGMVFAHGER